MSPSIRATWQKIATSEILQRSSQTVSVIGKSCYVFGGELEARVPRDAAVYRVAIDQGQYAAVYSVIVTETHLPGPQPSSAVADVSATARTPQARVGSATTTLREKFYMFSGRGGIAMQPIDEDGALWVFNPSSGGRWDQLGPKDPSAERPEARSYHALANDGHDSLYLHAGCPEKGRLADLWHFKLSEQKWTRLSSAPDPPRGGTSIAFSGGMLYRMNGFDGNTEQGGSIDVYDPQSNTWTTERFAADSVNAPEPRSVSALLPLDIDGRPHLLTCFGEGDPSALGHAGAGKMLCDVWAFDLENRKWITIEATGSEQDGSPAARGWFAAEASANGILIQGGLGEDNQRLGDLWLLSLR
ncbi:MAG: hypothetical protein M1828_004857 [Chrysothrix sp. TS-e1954]|nr:MAG: hypothetical protein M1828_004857 [Chrysothrix sp. TS-e1954]